MSLFVIINWQLFILKLVIMNDLQNRVCQFCKDLRIGVIVVGQYWQLIIWGIFICVWGKLNKFVGCQRKGWYKFRMIRVVRLLYIVMIIWGSIICRQGIFFKFSSFLVWLFIVCFQFGCLVVFWNCFVYFYLICFINLIFLFILVIWFGCNKYFISRLKKKKEFQWFCVGICLGINCWMIFGKGILRRLISFFGVRRFCCFMKQLLFVFLKWMLLKRGIFFLKKVRWCFCLK